MKGGKLAWYVPGLGRYGWPGTYEEREACLVRAGIEKGSKLDAGIGVDAARKAIEPDRKESFLVAISW